MGYSARYHATSLIAVFLALAIGILIGAEFGGETLTGTRRNLEHSLIGNLQDARERADQLSGELGRANEFGERVYPVLVRHKLRGRRIGDRRPRRPAGQRVGRGRGSPRGDRGAAGRGRRGARAGRPPRPRRRPRQDPLRRHRAQPGHADRVRRRGRAPARPRRRPAGTGAQPALLPRQRQLRRARRGDRRPRPAAGDGPGAARRRRPARGGADERHHRDPDPGRRGREHERRTLVGRPSSRATTSPASTTSIRSPGGWRWSSRCSARRAASASRAPPTACSRTC